MSGQMDQMNRTVYFDPSGIPDNPYPNACLVESVAPSATVTAPTDSTTFDSIIDAIGNFFNTYQPIFLSDSSTPSYSEIADAPYSDLGDGGSGDPTEWPVYDEDDKAAIITIVGR